jgi:hypothetical protein
MNNKWTYSLIALGIWLILLLISSILTIGSQLNRIHPYVEIAFYFFSFLLFHVSILKHIIRVIFSKEHIIPNIDNLEGTEKEKAIRLELNRLKKLPFFKNGLPEISDEEKQLNKSYELLDIASIDIIKSRSKNVFLSTSISQNGKLDLIFVLINQLTMIRELTDLNRHRTSLKDLFKLYSNVVVSAITADLLSESDLSNIIVTTLSSTSLANIPGASASGGIIASSLIEGSSDAFLTLRVGFLTKELLTNNGNKTKLRNNASSNAIKYFPTLVYEVAKMMTTFATSALGIKIKNVGEMVRDGGKTVVNSVAETASSVTDSVTDTAKSVSDSVIGTSKNIIDTVGDTASDVVNTISDTAQSLGGNVIKAVESASDLFTNDNEKIVNKTKKRKSD